MPIPGRPGSYVANGSEHDPMGDTTHLPIRHLQMTERRFNKLKLLDDGTYEALDMGSSIAIMPWGGSKGPAFETYKRLIESGEDISWYYTMYLNPLPSKLLDEIKSKDLVIIPELNYQGQFSTVLRSHGVAAESITQYTGLPFKVSDLEKLIRNRIEVERKKTTVL
jgi:2-oxoglutarate ferredoxin oxidoreductase subunit alpha